MSRKIFLNMAAQLAGRFYTSSVSFVVIMILLARTLDPGAFGIYNFYVNLYAVFVVFIDFGANTIAIREAAREPHRLPGLLRALLRMRVLLSSASLIAAWAVAAVLEKDHALMLWIAVASLHLLFHAFSGYGTVFHVEMRFGRVASISALGHTVFLIASAAAYLAGSRNPAVYLCAYGAGMAAADLGNYYFSRSLVPAAGPGPDSDRGEGRRLLREAIPMGFSSVMVYFYFYMDTFLLRPLKGEAQVGYYNAAYRILVFSIMVPVLFNQVVFPIYARFFSGKGDGLAGLAPFFRRAVLYMGAVGLPACVVLWVFAEPLIVLVAGETYRTSAPCLRVLGIAMALIFLTYPHTSLLIASGRQRLFAAITAGGAVVNLFLNLVLIPPYGILGAAWATVATEAFVLATAVLLAAHALRLTANLGGFYRIFAITGGAGTAALIMEPLGLFAALPLVGGLYFGMLYLARLLPFDMHDESRH